MKVAFLMGTLKPGGAETLILSVLRNAGAHSLDALCIYRHGGLLEEKYRQTGAKMIPCAIRGAWDIFAVFRLRRFLVKEKVDIVHANQVGDALLSILATAFSKVKVVYTIHGIIQPKHNPFDVTAFNMRHADRLVFVSEYERKWFAENYKLSDKVISKSNVLYNGIDMAKFNSSRNGDSSARSKLIIGTVGSFVSGRNQMFICHFLNALNLSGADFEFSFIGAKSEAEARLYDNCVKYCEKHSLLDKVHFLGPRNDVPELLKKMDAFIYATVADTFGIAVIEAIASGIPVFVNDWEVMREISDNGRYANIYISENVDDLMSQFADFRSNIASYKERALKNAEEIRKIYDIDTHIEHLVKIYNGIN